jgi:tRNA dimethylallyltransferase
MPRKVAVVALFGPTASGKTAVAEALAEMLGTEIVSADAMQVYRGLPILTNQSVRPARLVAFRDLSREMSVGEYEPLAHAEIDALIAECGTVVVAGGTGLYLRAALAQLDLPPAPDAGARSRWESSYDADPDQAYALLQERDAAAASLVHPNDRRRVVRALELAEAGSSLAPDENTLWTYSMRHPTLLAGLDVPADVLARRIRERTEAMFERGVVQEVERALEGPVSRTAARALGLQDIVELSSDDAKERIVRRTTRYAAYQRKWMRRLPDLALVDATRPARDVAKELLQLSVEHAVRG